MFIPVPIGLPRLAPEEGGGGRKDWRGVPKEKFAFPLLENTYSDISNCKIQKNNIIHDCEKGHVICLTGAPGPHGGPKPGAQGPKLQFSNITFSRYRSSTAKSQCV